MDTALATASLALKLKLRSQFPRFKLTVAVLKKDRDNREKLAPPGPEEFVPGDVLNRSAQTWIRGIWPAMSEIQAFCYDVDTQCGRRGCEKAGTARCTSCKRVLYCGAQCQKLWVNYKSIIERYVLIRRDRDWKSEHKPACKLIPFLLESHEASRARSGS